MYIWPLENLLELKKKKYLFFFCLFNVPKVNLSQKIEKKKKQSNSVSILHLKVKTQPEVLENNFKIITERKSIKLKNRTWKRNEVFSTENTNIYKNKKTEFLKKDRRKKINKSEKKHFCFYEFSFFFFFLNYKDGKYKNRKKNVTE